MKKVKPIWILAGLLALVFLLGKTGFIGSLVTTCDNDEPISLAAYQNQSVYFNGTFTKSSEGFALQDLSNPNITDAYQIFDMYYMDTPVATLNLIIPINQTCSQFQHQVDIRMGNTSFVELNNKDVLMTPDDYIWCNDNNNIAMKGTIQAFSDYIDYYIECTTTEVNDTAPAPQQPAGTGGGVIYTPPAPTTPPKASETELFSQSQKYWVSVVGAAVLLFMLYWFFEKGPKKGLIRK